MELLTPDLGLLFWMTLSFIIVLFILGKFAWKPILESIRQREEYINGAIEQANQARRELEKVKQDAEEILAEARKEREQMLKDAKELRSRIIAEAEEEGKKVKQRKLQEALQEIEAAKHNALKEIKDTVAELSLEIAEKVLRSELSDEKKQQEYIRKLLESSNLN